LWRKFSKEIFSSKLGDFFQRKENNVSTEYSLLNCTFLLFGEILQQKETLLRRRDGEGARRIEGRAAGPTKKRKTRSYIYVYTIHFKQRASGGAVLGSTVFPLFAVSWSA